MTIAKIEHRYRHINRVYASLGATMIALASAGCGGGDREPETDEVVEQSLESGELAVWKNVVDVAAGVGALTRTNGGGWSGGASSVQAITQGDGFVEFTTARTDRDQMAGLGHDDASPGYHDIEFAFYPAGDGQLYIFESGGMIGNFGPYAAGDRFRVEVAGGQVRYRKNDALLHTSAAPVAYPLEMLAQAQRS